MVTCQQLWCQAIVIQTDVFQIQVKSEVMGFSLTLIPILYVAHTAYYTALHIACVVMNTNNESCLIL